MGCHPAYIAGSADVGSRVAAVASFFAMLVLRLTAAERGERQECQRAKFWRSQ